MQLTDTAKNCQYPVPTPTRLVATCTGAQNLDMYSLPLEGEVPSAWDASRIGEEAELTTSPAMQLLLYRHELAHETEVAAKRLTLLALVRIHIDLEEFKAAEFYVKRLPLLEDAATTDLAEPLLTLVAHRRSIRTRERGRVVGVLRAFT